MKISQAPGGGLTADIFSIDQPSPALHTSSFTREGSTVRFAVNLIGLNYEGTLSADGKTISGNWNQGTPPPLDFVSTTKEPAWEIPPPPPPKMMAADADPSIDVATIKPNKTGGDRLQGILETMVVGEGQGEVDSIQDASSADQGAAFGQDDSEFNVFNTDRQLAALQTAASMLGQVSEKKSLVYFASGLRLSGLDNQAQMRWSQTDPHRQKNRPAPPAMQMTKLSFMPG
jgi:hypothetical protein